MFSDKDILQLESFEIKQSQVLEQLELLKKNNSFLNLSAPAIPTKGIVQVLNNIDDYIEVFDKKKIDYSICKFVPASGAATRMFKRLIAYYQEPSLKNLHDGGEHSVKITFDRLGEFAFVDKLKSYCPDFRELETLANMILFEGLSYAKLPKGLIEFHTYEDGSRTPLEEHLHEAAAMGDSNSPIDIHFTISEEFQADFQKKIDEIAKLKKLNINVSFSFKESSTNTIAIYDDSSLVKLEDDSLLLRPGGHGALLQNLNKIDADIVFVKNIDNLVHESYLDETIANKKLIAGILIETIETLKQYYNNLSHKDVNQDSIDEAVMYLQNSFGADLSKTKNLKADILEFLDRPIRVCGMVKNTGEPGGGPFWIKDNQGNVSLQIVEKAQIDLSQADQLECFENSTHFNPVDLVCYLKSPRGEKFDLNDFVDKTACFISEKTHLGKNIRVLEHPGLWNGAMANWLTIFVEVPLITFNPVKELNDLLKQEHQLRK